MNTSFERRSSSGHAGRLTGGCNSCWTACTITGFLRPFTFNTPLTRRILGPSRPVRAEPGIEALEPYRLLRLSLDYTRIRKRDEVSPLSASYVLAHPDLLPGRVERAALSADDTARGHTVGRVTLLDLRLANLARSMTEVLDVQLDDEWRTARHGAFRPYLVATWQPTFERQTLPGSPTVNEAGHGELQRQGRTDGVFNKVRFNAGMAWEQGPLSVGVDLQFHSSCLITSPEAGFNGGRTNAEIVRRQCSGRITS